MFAINRKGAVGAFAFFIPLSLLFNASGIFLSSLESSTTFYLAIVFFILITFCLLLNRSKLFSISISSILNTPKPILRLLFLIYIFSMTAYFFSVGEIFSRGLPTPAEVYSTRLEAISISRYWMFVAITNIGLALSVIYLLSRQWLKWLLVSCFYVLFFIASMQKSPIFNILIIQAFFWVLNHGVSKRFIVIALSILFGFSYYLVAITLGDADLSRISLLIYALLNRTLVAGYLIVDVYQTFGNDIDFLRGATLPNLFGILDFNLTSRSVSLPALMMSFQGQDGGANTSFFAEGYANFGYGFDLVFIMFLFFYTAITILSIGLLAPKLKPLYILVTSIVMIELVHSDFWSFFSSQILTGIIFVLISFVAKEVKINASINK